MKVFRRYKALFIYVRVYIFWLHYFIGVIKSCIVYTLMEKPGVIKKPIGSSFRHSIKFFFHLDIQY